jgi:RNA polymerase sigma factor (sigma-70 family)
MDKNKDEQILEAIKTGNNTAVLSLLYKIALPKVIRFITQNNGDEEEAKDIFQDAVVALFNTVKLGKYDSGKDVGGFIYFVARNLWINRIKKKNKQISIKETEEYAISNSPLALMIMDEKQAAIRGLMDKIGTQCQELLKYTMYDKLSMKEVALKMGFAGETVAKSTHYRCKQKLAMLINGNKNLIATLKG